MRGSPDRVKTIQEVTLAAYLAWSLPPGVEPSLEASAYYDPSNFTFPFGTHIAAVKVNADTGEVELRRYVAVDDCGRVINPLIVDGQVHGGVVQGIAQALWEGAVYSPEGQLLTGSMMDYAVPKAPSVPDVHHRADGDPVPAQSRSGSRARARRARSRARPPS